jgi:hypothetical protein
MPREVGPGVTKVTVRFSTKVPRVVENDFVKAAPIVTGVGSVRPTCVPEVNIMLFVKMLVTSSGAPAVIVVAVVTLPVLAVRVPNGTKLNETLIGIAFAALPINDNASGAATAMTGNLAEIIMRSLTERMIPNVPPMNIAIGHSFL